jgi:hypothetical protein
VCEQPAHQVNAHPPPVGRAGMLSLANRISINPFMLAETELGVRQLDVQLEAGRG